jgi:hypothetical protein
MGRATIDDILNQMNDGCSIFRSIDLDESEEEVKASSGRIFGIVVANMAASPRYLKIYDAKAADVTVGTTTPVATIPVPTPATADGEEVIIPLPLQGLAFTTGITVAATTGLADDDTGAPGANEVILHVWYK